MALEALRQVLPEIERKGASLVAISPQTPATAREQATAKGLKFPVLSDRGAEVAKRYGLVFALPEYLRPLYQNFGIDLQKSNGDDTFQLPLAATYVLRADGTVAWAYVSTDYTTRAEPRDVLAALAELQ